MTLIELLTWGTAVAQITEWPKVTLYLIVTKDKFASFAYIGSSLWFRMKCVCPNICARSQSCLPND